MDSNIIMTIISAISGLIGVYIGSKLSIISQSKITDKQIHNNFQLAAMDKRLEVHQKAYKLWFEMQKNMTSDDNTRNNIHDRATKFWISNCLYLEPETSKQFFDCISNFIMFNNQWIEVREFKDKTSELYRDLKKYMYEIQDQVLDTDKYIFKGAKYPFIGIKLTNKIIEE